jgi:hypothetical protein
MPGFFDDSEIEKRLIQVLSDRTIQKCFNHKLTIPYGTEVETFIKHGTAFYEGRFIDDKFSLTWLKGNHITKELFAPYYNSDATFDLLSKAIHLYVKLHNNKTNIGTFMYNDRFGSEFLKYGARIIHDSNIVGLERLLNAHHKDLMGKAESIHGGNGLLATLSLLEWYTAHSKRLSELNRGTFSISPLANETTWITAVLEWSAKYGVFYAGSPQFYKFTENFTEVYHILWEGEVHTGLGRVDTDYEHKNGYSSPLSLLEELRRQG